MPFGWMGGASVGDDYASYVPDYSSPPSYQQPVFSYEEPSPYRRRNRLGAGSETAQFQGAEGGSYAVNMPGEYKRPRQPPPLEVVMPLLQSGRIQMEDLATIDWSNAAEPSEEVQKSRKKRNTIGKIFQALGFLVPGFAVSGTQMRKSVEDETLAESRSRATYDFLEQMGQQRHAAAIAKQMAEQQEAAEKTRLAEAQLRASTFDDVRQIAENVEDPIMLGNLAQHSFDAVLEGDMSGLNQVRILAKQEQDQAKANLEIQQKAIEAAQRIQLEYENRGMLGSTAAAQRESPGEAAAKARATAQAGIEGRAAGYKQHPELAPQRGGAGAADKPLPSDPVLRAATMEENSVSASEERIVGFDEETGTAIKQYRRLGADPDKRSDIWQKTAGKVIAAGRSRPAEFRPERVVHILRELIDTGDEEAVKTWSRRFIAAAQEQNRVDVAEAVREAISGF